MQNESEDKYIEAVSTILYSQKDNVVAVGQIASLQLPNGTASNIPRFILKAASDLEWNGNEVYEYLEGQAFLDEQSADAARICHHIENLVHDYKTKNWYTYIYSATASYKGTYEIYLEHVNLAPENESYSLEVAKSKTRALKRNLPDHFFVVERKKGMLLPGNYRATSFCVEGVLRDSHGEIKAKDHFYLHD